MGLNTIPRAITNYNPTDAEFRNSDLSQFLALRATGDINIVGPNNFSVDVPDTVVINTSDTTVTSEFTVVGHANITSGLNMNGTVIDNLQVGGGSSAATVDYVNLVHSGSGGGSGGTGAVGPAGPAGPQGDTGVTGDTGPEGPVGETGLIGPIGPQGAVGQAGQQGWIGLPGIPGSDGSDGADSTVPGPIGPEGPMGIVGGIGLVGPVGPIGETGPQGIQGEQGAQAESGINVDGGHANDVYTADQIIIGGGA